jgi:hypothetical protein
MTEAEYNQAIAESNVNFIEPTQQPDKPLQPLGFNEYQAIIETLRRPRRHLTAAPTFTPKTLFDQIQFYDDGINRRTYFYVNGTWRYSTLT